MDIVGFLSKLPELLGFHLALIFGLITFDLMVGIGRAIRWNDFRWHMIAQFYWTNVIPFMFGYLGYAGFVMFVTPYIDQLPPEVADLLSGAAAWVGFGVVCAQIVNSIWRNIKDLANGPPPAPELESAASEPPF